MRADESKICTNPMVLAQIRKSRLGKRYVVDGVGGKTFTPSGQPRRETAQRHATSTESVIASYGANQEVRPRGNLRLTG